MWKQNRDAWSYSLEDPVTGSRSNFRSLGTMLDFLIRQMKSNDQGEDPMQK
jgi:hypothetical protein